MLAAFVVSNISCGNPQQSKGFNVWATSDSHITSDLLYQRESMSEAVRQSEFGGETGGPAFSWDIMLHLGDLVGRQGTPDDEEGQEVQRQLLSARKHRREQIYNVLGNHDASGPDEPAQWWFKKWIDPLGKDPHRSRVHPERRPFPVSGTWERYTFQAGNILFIMLSDRNDGGPPAGRGPRGGYPAGRVTRETFEWWVETVEENQDKIIITCHHHMLKNTTVASGEWEGVERGYHGRREDGAPVGASYLYFVGDEPDAQAFEKYLSEHPGAIDLWLGGHTHAYPDDTYGGKSHIERKWGVTFVNVAALARHHARKYTVPMSRLLMFAPGADEVIVKCYLHTSDYAPQGWYNPAERIVQLRREFHW